MVKTRPSTHAKTTRQGCINAIGIFGRNLTLRTVTRTLDNDGQLVSISNSDSTIKGDLQYGFNLDQRMIQAGYVEVGEAILYLSYNVTQPNLQDQIVLTNAVWEIVDIIEAPNLGGSDIFKTYKCRRMPNSND